ncbi:ATP-binding protein [Agrobacterium tumefaciens]|uniref:ATP-binding protein n=1 Tax=Agrobacterium tumefaciens TaxID=358 RepID=UPI00157424D1|nr:ATP-binding protein [Agrobacterium tumefaciens]
MSDDDWLIRGKALLTTARKAGATTARTFDFQKAFALLKLVDLLTAQNQLVRVRYEGAQDTDLFFGDGRQAHIQVKDYRAVPLTWTDIRSVLAGFVQDDLDARNNNVGRDVSGILRFELVGVGQIVDGKIFEIARGTHLRKHARDIAGWKFKACSKDEIESYINLAVDVLSRTTVELSPQGTPADTYRLMAEARLMRFGVAPESIDAALDRLASSISGRPTFVLPDVIAAVSDFVAESHPASGKSPIVLPPIGVKTSHARSADFYRGFSEFWPAIAMGFDVRRDAFDEAIASIRKPHVTKLLVSGPSGAGKSTLIRRMAWDLQMSGHAIVFELVEDSDLDDAWNELFRLSALLKRDNRFAVLLVDDVFQRQGLVDRIYDIPLAANLKVMATGWPGSSQRALGEGAEICVLGAISQKEALDAALRASSHLDILNNDQVERLLESGQFLLLNLALLGSGTHEEFGHRIVEMISGSAPGYLEGYLDLCVCGLYDYAIPRSVLERRSSAGRMDEVPALEGLVFKAGLGSMLKSGHRIIASAVCAAAISSIVLRMLSLAKAAEYRQDADRRFAIQLLEFCIEKNNLFAAHAYADEIAELCQKISSQGSYLDCKRLANVLGIIEFTDEKERMGDIASSKGIRNGQDAAAFRADSEDLGQLERAFPILMEFYDRNDTAWGRRNFLRSLMKLPVAMRLEAVKSSWKWLDRHLDQELVMKTTFDLLTPIPDSPSWVHEFLNDVLSRAPKSVLVARAAATLSGDRLRKRSTVDQVLDYGIAVLTGASFDVALAANLTTCARYGDPIRGKALFDLVVKQVNILETGKPRSRLIRLAAALASKDELSVVQALLGEIVLGEPAKVTATRYHLQRKALAQL